MDGLNTTTILWVRNDLRLRDNQALDYAISLGRPIVPVFILEDEGSDWSLGRASRWWLHYALKDFQQKLNALGLQFIFKREKSVESCLCDLVKSVKAECIVWNRRYDQVGMETDMRVIKKMRSLGVKVETFIGNVLFEPGSILNKSGKPYRVFTPFYNHVRDIIIEKSYLISPRHLVKYDYSVRSEELDSFNLLSAIKFDQDLGATWDPSIDGGERLLEKFVSDKIREYSLSRDFPAVEGTSRLSPYLHFGQISVKQIYSVLSSLPTSVRDPYYRQIIWREFAWTILYFFPETASLSFKKEFENLGWEFNEELFNCWREGRTGYPIVDAGMRELRETGWMHNRVRMIVASFLVKNLMVHWIEGAKWFWDNLVDADLANNSFGWQWVAGSGLDASPFFRIFNPIIQSQKFDPEGLYIKRYVPELREVPSRWIHDPWKVKNRVVVDQDVGGYPHPVVSYNASKIYVLRAYNRMRDLK